MLVNCFVKKEKMKQDSSSRARKNMSGRKFDKCKRVILLLWNKNISFCISYDLAGFFRQIPFFLPKPSSWNGDICIEKSNTAYSLRRNCKWALVKMNFVPRWRENEAQLDWGANKSSCLFLFPFNVLLKIFSSQIEWEAKLLSFDTDWFGEAIVEYCFLTPTWVHNSADNNGKKVDTQNVDLTKKCCFLHARWVLTFTGNPSGK